MSGATLCAFALTFAACGLAYATRVRSAGGVALFAGVAAAAAWQTPAQATLFWLLVAALPLGAAALAQDLTGRIASGDRLLCALAGAALAFLLLDARVTDVGLPGGVLLELPLLSFLVTVFAVAGFAHAMHTVDGLRGQCALVAFLMLAGLGVVAAQVDDQPLVLAVLLVAAALLAFLAWNFPGGRVLAGEHGACLLGFLIAELAVLLVQRNPNVSPWFAVALLAYPLAELGFSLYRRGVIFGQWNGLDDGLQLHALIHRRLARRSGLTALYLAALCALSVVPAALFWQQTAALQAVAGAFVLVYVWLYWAIVRFRAPRALVLRG